MLCLWPQLHREPGPFIWSAFACGSCVPDFGSRMGRTFRTGLQTETVSRIRRSEWDAFSGRGLKWKVWTGIRSSLGCIFRLKPQAETASRNSVSERVVLSGSALNRKLRPSISLQSGMNFPAEPSGGKFIPELTLRVGHGFRIEPQRKLRPSLSVYSGMRFPLKGSTGKYIPF